MKPAAALYEARVISPTAAVAGLPMPLLSRSSYSPAGDALQGGWPDEDEDTTDLAHWNGCWTFTRPSLLGACLTTTCSRRRVLRRFNRAASIVRTLAAAEVGR